MAQCRCGWQFDDIYVIRPGFAAVVCGTLGAPLLAGACVLLGTLVEHPSRAAAANFVGVLGPGLLLGFLAVRGFVGGRTNALAGLTSRFWTIAFCVSLAATVLVEIYSPGAATGLIVTTLVCAIAPPRIRALLLKYGGD